MNVERKPEFSQVVVWPGAVVGADRVAAFEQWMLDNFGARVQYLEEVKTNPDRDTLGEPVPGTGERNDVLFGIHAGDIEGFAHPRFAYGMRWVEDAVAAHNGGDTLYPEHVKGYCTWDAAEDLSKVAEDPNIVLLHQACNHTPTKS